MFTSLRIACVCSLMLAAAGPVHSRVAQGSDSDSLWLAASNQQLDGLRGGFSLGNGLMVSFGITRAVYINDQLVTTITLQLGDITRLKGLSVTAPPPQLSVATSPEQLPVVTQGQVIQIGPGNAVDSAMVLVPMATYIQNTLNNQRIRSDTVIQAASNGLGLLRSMNLQATINESIANAIRTR